MPPNVDASASAKLFLWEAGVPVNRFWDDIDWIVGHHFFGNSSAQELAQQELGLVEECGKTIHALVGQSSSTVSLCAVDY